MSSSDSHADSAREEIIELLSELIDTEQARTILDAIPADLLARHAIARGGLVETDKTITVRRDHTGGGRIRNTFAPLYRLAEVPDS